MVLFQSFSGWGMSFKLDTLIVCQDPVDSQKEANAWEYYSLWLWTASAGPEPLGLISEEHATLVASHLLLKRPPAGMEPVT